MFRHSVPMLVRSLAVLALTSVVSMAIDLQPTNAAEIAFHLPGDPVVAVLLSAEQALLALTNADRVANGVAPLQMDTDTLLIARERAQTQIDTPALSHYDADGELVFVKLLSGARLKYELAGENLARTSQTDPQVTARIEQALMASPTHRKNILEPSFNRVSIGAATNASGELTIAEVYRN